MHLIYLEERYHFGCIQHNKKFWVFGGYESSTYEVQNENRTKFLVGKLPAEIRGKVLAKNISPFVYNKTLHIFLYNGVIYKYDYDLSIKGKGKEWIKISKDEEEVLPQQIHKVLSVTENILASYPAINRK